MYLSVCVCVFVYVQCMLLNTVQINKQTNRKKVEKINLINDLAYFLAKEKEKEKKMIQKI